MRKENDYLYNARTEAAVRAYRRNFERIFGTKSTSGDAEILKLQRAAQKFEKKKNANTHR